MEQPNKTSEKFRCRRGICRCCCCRPGPELKSTTRTRLKLKTFVADASFWGWGVGRGGEEGKGGWGKESLENANIAAARGAASRSVDGHAPARKIKFFFTFISFLSAARFQIRQSAGRDGGRDQAPPRTRRRSACPAKERIRPSVEKRRVSNIEFRILSPPRSKVQFQRNFVVVNFKKTGMAPECSGDVKNILIVRRLQFKSPNTYLLPICMSSLIKRSSFCKKRLTKRR
jgi:hypothetical protein